MKTKNLYALTGLFLLFVILMTGGCSKKGGENSSDTDTVRSVNDQSEASALEPQDIVLTSEGISPVTIGMQISLIPADSAGIYDSVISEEGYESNSYLFMSDGQPMFTAYEFTPGTIDVVSADSPRIVVMSPDGKALRLGGELADVLSLPGVEAEWESADGEGMWCWRWEGLWFQPDQSHLPEDLSRALYNDAKAPGVEMMTPEVKIGYIGTGLPW